MDAIADLRDEPLREYAQLLNDNGFAIYLPDRSDEYFVYSRVVDGQECFGTFMQCTHRSDGYRHTMPITPSRENGSSMFLEDIEDGYDNRTVAAAEEVARPENSNHKVGTQQNYRDRFIDTFTRV